MKVQVYNTNGEVVGDIELADQLFGIKPNQHLMAESVRVQLSNKRTGLAHTKTRGEVRGGGKKPWKQKGTGRARVGSIRSPLWRHGGVTFGPKSSRNWSLKMNREAKTQALLMALSDKVKHNKFFVLEHLELPEQKTKAAAAFLNSFANKLSLGNRNLLLFSDSRQLVARAFRNLPRVTMASAKNLNIVDILKATDIVLPKESVEVLHNIFKRQTAKRVSKK